MRKPLLKDNLTYFFMAAILDYKCVQSSPVFFNLRPLNYTNWDNSLVQIMCKQIWLFPVFKHHVQTFRQQLYVLQQKNVWKINKSSPVMYLYSFMDFTYGGQVFTGQMQNTCFTVSIHKHVVFMLEMYCYHFPNIRCTFYEQKLTVIKWATFFGNVFKVARCSK